MSVDAGQRTSSSPRAAQALRLVAARVDQPSRVEAGERPDRNLDDDLKVIIVPGSGVDVPEELLASLEAGLDKAGAVDDGGRVIPFPSPSCSRLAGSETTAAMERMAEATMRLARRTEALEDFAALVAHELKSPLQAALLAEEPRPWIECALELVELLLQATNEPPHGTWASVPDCLDEAARGLRPVRLTVAVEGGTRFPLPPRSLSVILRNLLANAAAGQARRVDVRVAHRRRSWWLVLDDDGVGLGGCEHEYDHGIGIGLELCRRIAKRSGGCLGLTPGIAGGARAILRMDRAA